MHGQTLRPCGPLTLRPCGQTLRPCGQTLWADPQTLWADPVGRFCGQQTLLSDPQCRQYNWLALSSEYCGQNAVTPEELFTPFLPPMLSADGTSTLLLSEESEANYVHRILNHLQGSLDWGCSTILRQQAWMDVDGAKSGYIQELLGQDVAVCSSDAQIWLELSHGCQKLFLQP